MSSGVRIPEEVGQYRPETPIEAAVWGGSVLWKRNCQIREGKHQECALVSRAYRHRAGHIWMANSLHLLEFVILTNQRSIKLSLLNRAEPVRLFSIKANKSRASKWCWPGRGVTIIDTYRIVHSESKTIGARATPTENILELKPDPKSAESWNERSRLGKSLLYMRDGSRCTSKCLTMRSCWNIKLIVDQGGRLYKKNNCIALSNFFAQDIKQFPKHLREMHCLCRE